MRQFHGHFGQRQRYTNRFIDRKNTGKPNGHHFAQAVAKGHLGPRGVDSVHFAQQTNLSNLDGHNHCDRLGIAIQARFDTRLHQFDQVDLAVGLLGTDRPKATQLFSNRRGIA